MSKSIKITIPEPCHENWNAMTPTDQGRHCAVCTKEVIDFTAKTDQEIALLIQGTNNICGRMRTDQVNRDIQFGNQKESAFSTNAKTDSLRQTRFIPSYFAALLLPLTMGITPEITSQNNILSTQKTTRTYQSLGIGSQPLQGRIAPHTQISIKGVLTDPYGSVLPNAIVDVKNANRGVLTDEDGKFEIDVFLGEIVLFSYLGFETAERKVTSQKTIHVVLNELTMMGEPIMTIKGKMQHKNISPQKKKDSKQ